MVLNSPQAVTMSVYVVRAFMQMRDNWPPTPRFSNASRKSTRPCWHTTNRCGSSGRNCNPCCCRPPIPPNPSNRLSRPRTPRQVHNPLTRPAAPLLAGVAWEAESSRRRCRLRQSPAHPGSFLAVSAVATALRRRAAASSPLLVGVACAVPSASVSSPLTPPAPLRRRPIRPIGPTCRAVARRAKADLPYPSYPSYPRRPARRIQDRNCDQAAKNPKFQSAIPSVPLVLHVLSAPSPRPPER